ncbi:hypothetical protein PPYR_04103 [Photinus pyralis]|uniref:Ribonuclease n=1 Tax=Photinus pyralis TaxID=7054 RepID=A0A1Y1KLQ2_PHOPY|nr:ribonuclease H2 subunit A [Photinus pyralis]KAB0801917.1 hypothetical protein PPYR_04103 [Photinus pyralis]
MDTPDTGTNIISLDSLNTFLSQRDNSENAFYISTIPKMCTEAPCILGIDEAGRGPVLGPMVYGIAFCPIDKNEMLKSFECADSKALTEAKRDEIFSNMCTSTDVIGWAVDIISPNRISNSMLSLKKHSLNEVSKESAIGLIKAVAFAGVVIEHIYVDTLGSQPEKYQAYLLNIFPNYKITVAKKADSLYPIVSAASIFAKVTRDHSLQTWKFSEGFDLNHKDFGSGYPGDPVTKKFLKEYLDPVFGFPQIVRFSWSTASKILESDAYPVEWMETEDENPKSTQSTQITSFFKMDKETKKKHSFFAQMCLTNSTPF